MRSSRPVSLSGLLVAVLALSACGGESAAGDPPDADPAATPDTASAVVAEAPAPVQEPVGPATDLPPNELGEIMVLEYHRLGEPEGEFVRKAENFRKDLESLYQAGYRPITMRQFLAGDIDVPRGTTPVVFTIDDSSRGQFYLREDGSIDPNTMVGMWEAFQRQNPEWHHGATWCVLPAADHPSNFFGEKPSREVPREQREAAIQRKVDYLIENRHEICNHTLYHARLDRATGDAQVQEWIGRGEDSIRVYLPEDYDVVTLALPLGMWPRNRALAWRGEWNGRTYEYEGVLEVSGGPSVSPFDAEYDPRSVDRFIVAPGHLERQLQAYERNPGRRYVSDGDPGTITVPESAASRVDRERWSSLPVRTAPDAAPADAPPAGEAGS